MYYIYQHLNSEKEVFYIGKGTSTNNNYYRASRSSQRSNLWKNAAMNGFTYSIIFESNNEELVLIKEIELINNCQTCINKVKQRRIIDYKLLKISELKGIFSSDNFNNSFTIFSNGKVINNSSNKEVNYYNKNKYLTFSPIISGKEYSVKHFSIHRLLAELFIANPYNKPCVNHIDRNTSNNKISNLEWCTQKENITHSRNLGSYDIDFGNNPILKISLTGNIENEFLNVKYAALSIGKRIMQLKKVVNNFGIISNSFWINKKDFEKLLKSNTFTKVNNRLKNITSINKEYNENLHLYKYANKLISNLAEKYHISKKTAYVWLKLSKW